MKIGILTYHNAVNYGAVLQAFALLNKLNSIDGVNASIIDYKSIAVEQQYRLLSRESAGSLKNFLLSNITWLLRRGKRKKFNIFLHSKDGLAIESNRMDFKIYDIVIVGSDQVWNPNCTMGDITYLLPYNKHNTKKISYAASIGDPKNIEGYQKDYNIDYLKYLLDFNRISVREEDSKTFLIKNGVECTSVIDPVLLFGAERWMSYIRLFNEQYILVYNLGNFKTLKCFLEMFNKEKKLRVLVINKDIKGDIMYYQYKNISSVHPLSFVELIANASYVITDSFHATAFSIMFHKEFFTVSSDSQNANTRIINLLSRYGLIERHINRNNYCKKSFSTIDYDYVENILSKDRLFSEKWLMNSIKDDE